MEKKYNQDVFKYLSDGYQPDEERKKVVLAYLNDEIGISDLGPAGMFYATVILSAMGTRVDAQDARKEMTQEDYYEFCANVGVDPDTGRPHTNVQDAIFEEKFEKRYGNIPR
jgi:hypothetical protein